MRCTAGIKCNKKIASQILPGTNVWFHTHWTKGMLDNQQSTTPPVLYAVYAEVQDCNPVRLYVILSG